MLKLLRVTSRKEFSMSSTTHLEQSTSSVLYVALELSRDSWLLTMSVGVGGRRRRVTVHPTRQQVLAAIETAKAGFGLARETAVRSCHEAGRDGFWPHRLLTALGVSNVVVDSSSIEVPRRARRAKTDRLDGEKLLRLLLRYWAGERDCWHVVRVPSAALEAARHDSRALTTLQQERTRYRNRIHSLLALDGVRLVIDQRLPARLAGARDWEGMPLRAAVQARVLETWRLLQAVEAERATRRRAERQRVRTSTGPTAAAAHTLAQLHGVGARTATILADELFSRALRNRRQVGALCGLVSTPYDSGSRQIDQGLARSGIPAVRRLAVEVAWLWVQYQPTSTLTQWYQTKFGRGGPALRRVGIVALARRLMIALWRYVDQGIAPAGARLRA
jgi:transposase